MIFSFPCRVVLAFEFLYCIILKQKTFLIRYVWSSLWERFSVMEEVSVWGFYLQLNTSVIRNGTAD